MTVQVATPAALGIAALAGGRYQVGAIMLGLAGLAALTFYLWCAIIHVILHPGVKAHTSLGTPT